MKAPTMQDYGFPVNFPGKGTRIMPIFGGCGSPGGCGPTTAPGQPMQGLRGLGKLGVPNVFGLRGRIVTDAQGRFVSYEPDGWDYARGVLGAVGLGMGIYHGYKRSGTWAAVGYGALGAILPPIGIPVFFIQGYGKKKR